MPHHVHHVAYLTDDVATATEFYRTVFDADVFIETENPDTGSRLAFLRFGTVEVELIEPADQSRLEGRSGLVLDHVGIVVEDLDATIKDLTERGVAFAAAAPRVGPDGMRLMQIDPAGALGTRMHLSERPAAEPGVSAG